jgi:hypothetical protein
MDRGVHVTFPLIFSDLPANLRNDTQVSLRVSKNSANKNYMNFRPMQAVVLF